MSQRITIEIKDKIATCLTELPIVCGNGDYEIDFVFDEEWNKHNVKTAMFVVNGESQSQVFEGNVCKVPVLQNTLFARVGVFAGTIDDGTLSTSTPAFVRCVPCITDGGNVPAPPKDDEYNQIVELCETAVETAKSVEERANNGEFNGEKGEKGEKGDAGSIKFKAVTVLPTENIDESAIYIVPLESGAEENRYKEYVYINGEWEKLGEITVEVDHSEYVKKLTGSGNVLYAKLGNETKGITFAYSPVANTMAYRDSNGNFQVNAPVAEKDCVPNDYLQENYVQQYKTGGATRIYGVNRQGAQVQLLCADIASAIQTQRVAMYVSDAGTDINKEPNGALVTKTPVKDYQCANKKYVDEVVAALEARIAELESK